MKNWTADEEQRLLTFYSALRLKDLITLLSPRTKSAVINKIHRMALCTARPRKNWRAICNNHKPRIVLTQPIPAEPAK